MKLKTEGQTEAFRLRDPIWKKKYNRVHRSRSYYELIQRLIWLFSLLAILANLKSKFINQTGQDFKCEAVIINKINTSASLLHMFSNNGFLTRIKLKFVDIPASRPCRSVILLILLLSGDIESNPGPPEPAPKSMFPCAICQQVPLCRCM